MNPICGNYCVGDNIGFYLIFIVLLFFGEAIKELIFGKDKDDK